MKIRIERNYSYPDFFRQTPNNDGKWGDLSISYNSLQKCDILIVFNQYADNSFNLKVREGGRLLIVQEPPYLKNKYYVQKPWEFDKIVSHFGGISQNLRIPAMLPWMVDKDYSFLKAFDIESVNRSEDVVWITSRANQNPGHSPRLSFLKKIESESRGYSLFGRGIKPIGDKFNALVGSKYSIAVENYSDSDYFTEKVIDSFLSGSFPFYYGCTNLETYFPEKSFMYIDINDPERAVAIIREAISNKLWEKNIDQIKEARRLILDEYQIFPMLNKMLNNGTIKLGDYKNYRFNKVMTFKEKLFMKLNIYKKCF